MSEDEKVSSVPAYPVALAKLYRPLSLAVRTCELSMQYFVLVRAEASQSGLISLAYIDLSHFDIVHGAIPSSWELINKSIKLFEMGVPDILNKLSAIHELLATGDESTNACILLETSTHDYRL
jgi:hypothetical protein